MTLAFKDAGFTENTVYEKLLADKLPVNLGAVYKNVVAQELVAHGHRLFYHTWPKEGANRNYEIDFILPDGKIWPRCYRYTWQPESACAQPCLSLHA